jgi:hypothetical protein
MVAQRRRRRRRSVLFAERVIRDVKRKEREFLRDVSKMLSEAIGFPVRVSRVKLAEPTSIEMRRARRMTKKQARQQIANAFAPVAAPAAEPAVAKRPRKPSKKDAAETKRSMQVLESTLGKLIG